MAKTNKIYTDIDFNFNIHPATGKLGVVYDETAITQSIVNLIRTNYYGRSFTPFVGGNVTKYLFEPATQFTVEDIKYNVISVIEKYEKRATIIDVKVDILFDDNLNVSVYYSARNITALAEFVLERIR